MKNESFALPILSVKNLTVTIPSERGSFNPVQDLSFDLNAGEKVGIVGESGSGKSMTMRALLRLLPKPARIAGGQINFAGRDVLRLNAKEMAALRGSDIAMVFQDPMSSWNPVLTVGAQIGETMSLHQAIKPRAIRERVIALLQQVGIPAAAQRAGAYPHEFSGGMRQRGMVGMGLANRPRVLIADEPTTALDVTVQDQIIRLLRQVNAEFGTALLLITHNLALVASLCDRVIVMYAGRVVEQGPVRDIFRDPQHPYTWGLLQSVPRLDQALGGELYGIPGQPVDASQNIKGCKFAPRCAFSQPRCTEEEPGLTDVGDRHQARCWVMMHNTGVQTKEAVHA